MSSDLISLTLLRRARIGTVTSIFSFLASNANQVCLVPGTVLRVKVAGHVVRTAVPRVSPCFLTVACTPSFI